MLPNNFSQIDTVNLPINYIYLKLHIVVNRVVNKVVVIEVSSSKTMCGGVDFTYNNFVTKLTDHQNSGKNNRTFVILLIKFSIKTGIVYNAWKDK